MGNYRVGYMHVYMMRGVYAWANKLFLNTAIRVHYYVLSRREQTPILRKGMHTHVDGSVVL